MDDENGVTYTVNLFNSNIISFVVAYKINEHINWNDIPIDNIDIPNKVWSTILGHICAYVFRENE